MPIKIYKPTTPSRRYTTVEDFSVLTKKKPEKSLLLNLHRSKGRGAQGNITVRHKGGGHKRQYRLVDFRRINYDIPAKVLAIEYDPNRSAFIALIEYQGGKKSYILASASMKVGAEVLSSQKKIKVKDGNRMPLRYITIGANIYNIEMNPGRGGQIVKAAGNSAQLMARENGVATIKLPSGEIRSFSDQCMATVGTLSNIDHGNIVIGKAGRMRWMGIRPSVRGKAMNPVDHPHGGGEGRSSIGMVHPKTPWGKPALGVKTRKANKKSSRYIIQKRKK